jgi:hypothetical protein
MENWFKIEIIEKKREHIKSIIDYLRSKSEKNLQPASSNTTMATPQTTSTKEKRSLDQIEFDIHTNKIKIYEDDEKDSKQNRNKKLSLEKERSESSLNKTESLNNDCVNQMHILNDIKNIN